MFRGPISNLFAGANMSIWRLHCIMHHCGVISYRLQALKEPAYSQKEAEMIAGMGNYVVKALSNLYLHEREHKGRFFY